MTRRQSIPSPKRQPSLMHGRQSWFPYYAGYTETFVESVISSHLSRGQILDPWNGAGTTTTVAARLNRSCTGIDLNPAMAIIAKAKLISPLTTPSIEPISRDICKRASISINASPNDPLTKWFAPQSAATIRAIHDSIVHHLVNHDCRDSVPIDIKQLSDIACFFLLALFRAVKHYTSRIRCSNPTWIRSPDPRQRLKPSRAKLIQIFREEVKELKNQCGQDLLSHEGALKPTILVGDARQLPARDQSYSGVVGSPPYCTRIDYAVSTSLELAIIGFSDQSLKSLRENLSGTTMIRRTQCNDSLEDLPITATALHAIENHQSKGSRNYYAKNFAQYFHDLRASLREVHRVLRKSGKAVLVVQDSYYKDFHVDLQSIAVEMGEAVGLLVQDRHDFVSSQNMIHINSRARRYRGNSPSHESVLILKK